MNSKYVPPSLTTDAGVLRTGKDGRQEVLLIRRGKSPFKGQLAFPGGFVDYGEDPQVGCLRELKEETNLDGSQPKLIGVYGNPQRDPRRHTVSIFYTVHVSNFDNLKGGDDAADAQFYPVDEILKKLGDLAFDHAQLMKDLLKGAE